MLSERRTQIADERRSEVKCKTLSIALIATNQLVGLLRFGSTHCYPPIRGIWDKGTSDPEIHSTHRLEKRKTATKQAKINAVAMILTLRPGMSSPNKSRTNVAKGGSEPVSGSESRNETIAATTPKQNNTTAIGAT